MPKSKLPWPLIIGLLLAALAAGGVVWVVRGAQQLPNGPQAIDWHRQPCGHCQMLVGEPHHAAQLITQSGDVHSFDDPGCALRFLDERKPAVHQLWFHHAKQDRWLAAANVGFLTNGVTPMASGLLAVDRNTPAAIPLAQAASIAATKLQAGGKP